MGCVAMLDLVLLFLVTLVVVFNALATVSMLLKAIYVHKLFPTPYTTGSPTHSLAAISLDSDGFPISLC